MMKLKKSFITCNQATTASARRPVSWLEGFCPSSFQMLTICGAQSCQLAPATIHKVVWNQPDGFFVFRAYPFVPHVIQPGLFWPIFTVRQGFSALANRPCIAIYRQLDQVFSKDARPPKYDIVCRKLHLL